MPRAAHKSRKPGGSGVQRLAPKRKELWVRLPMRAAAKLRQVPRLLSKVRLVVCEKRWVVYPTPRSDKALDKSRVLQELLRIARDEMRLMLPDCGAEELVEKPGPRLNGRLGACNQGWKPFPALSVEYPR